MKVRIDKAGRLLLPSSSETSWAWYLVVPSRSVHEAIDS